MKKQILTAYQILIRNINDIISGDILTLRNGEVGVVIETHLGKSISIESGGWLKFSDYNRDLTDNYNKCFDIVKVCRISDLGQVCSNLIKYAPIIWERKENHTIEETEEETVIRIPKGVEFEFKTK